MPLYWFFGRSRLGGYVKAREQLIEDTEDLVEVVESQLKDSRCKDHLFSYAENLTGLIPTSGNQLELFPENESAFSAILEAIDEAQEYVLAQFYVIRDDQAGRNFLSRLREAVQRGVRVYLYYDPLETGLPAEVLDQARESGIKTASHTPGKSGLDPLQGNFRNHRKLVIADGKVALLGGMNVGDNYLSREEEQSPWNDLFMRLRGPAVLNTQLSFYRDYYYFSGDKLELNWEAPEASEGHSDIAVFPTDPGDVWDSCGLAFTQAINGAKERIILASPYFLPDGKALAALQNAVLRGVRVQVLRPNKTLVKSADWAAWHYIEELLPHGVEFYKQPEGVMHKKVLLVDQDLCLIGSANFDYRSFHLNHELFLWIRCSKTTAHMEELLTKDLEKFEQLTSDDLQKRNVLERLVTEVTALAVPLL